MKRPTHWLRALALFMVSTSLLGCAEERRRNNNDDDDESGNGGFAGGVGGFAAGGNGGSGANTGGTGGSPTECIYPTGPYNVEQGSIVPPTLTWQGYVPDSTTPTTISMQDFFDCDGTRNIDAVLIDTSQFG